MNILFSLIEFSEIPFNLVQLVCSCSQEAYDTAKQEQKKSDHAAHKIRNFLETQVIKTGKEKDRAADKQHKPGDDVSNYQPYVSLRLSLHCRFCRRGDGELFTALALKSLVVMFRT